jgi:hypothetical protein
MSDINTVTTHDLWVEARQFKIDLSRPTPDTLELKLTRPASLSVADGAVVILGTAAVDANGWPSDGEKYTGSTVYGDPAADVIYNHQVIAFYSGIMGAAFPTGTVNGTNIEWTLTVTGTDPNAIYYASVHAASKILQYYPLGVQSYPLEAANLEKNSSTFAGSIPSLPSAPTSPTPGMVYYDQQLKIVQYWDSTRSVWVPTRTDTIMSGTTNPGVLGQTYLLAGNALKVFDGKSWVKADATNMMFLTNGTWSPLGSVQGLTDLPPSPVVGDVVYNFTSARVQYWDGSAWQIPTPSTALFNNAGVLVPAFTTPFTTEYEDLFAPYVGLLYYNTSQHQLNVWNGSSWEKANTDQEGSPTTDKIGIGNDGTYDQRIRLVNILKAQLGWPAQCVELSEEQFNIAIDNALDTYRQLSVGGYEQRFMVYNIIPGQQVYFLNSPVDRTDAVVSVMKVHRLNLLGINGAGPDNTWGMAYAQQFASIISGGALLDTHLIHSWTDEFTRLFAGDLPFTWNEARRELFIKRAIRTNEKVVLEVEIERSEQELLLDRWCKQWLQGWAIAECKEVLGLIRSKYSSGTPGAAGTITLNGDTLLSEARQDFTDLREQLLNYEANNAEHGNLALLIG